MNRKILSLMTGSIMSMSAINFAANSAYGFVINSEGTRKNGDCSKKNNLERKPYEESVDRATCEKFTKNVGTVNGRHEHLELGLSYIGTATLIKPDIILTAAHLVSACKNDPKECTFTHNGSTIQFSDVSLPQEYIEALNDIQLIPSELGESTFNMYNDLMEPISDLIRKFPDLNIDTQDLINYLTDLGFDKKNIPTMTRYLRAKKNMQEYDIALVKLENKFPIDIEGDTQLISDEIENEMQQKINREKKENMWGVSANNITDNKDGKVISENIKHIAVIKINKLDPKTHTLSATYTIPTPYNSKCHMDENGNAVAYPVRFETEKNDPFLMGAGRPGDSGGPLIYLSNKVPYLVGVARLIRATNCKNISELVAGKSYENEWTSINSHKIWIENTLKKWGY